MSENSANQNKSNRYLSPLMVWGLSIGCAVGWGAFMMPGTTFLHLAGPLGTAIGLIIGALIILIIGANYHYMINHYPDDGGTILFAKQSFGNDHAFLSAWFLIIVYISIAWANATALPLIFRNLWGNIFQFGFHYRLAGYDVWFGEALLSLITIFVVCGLCCLSQRIPGILQVIFALTMVGGILIGFLFILSKNESGFIVKPSFSPSTEPLFGVLHIIALIPWAFVGFESISHFSEEYNFSHRKTGRIILLSVATGALCYIALALIAVSATPDEGQTWYEYVTQLPEYTGIKSVPVFNAVNHYLGNQGVVLFGFAVLGAVMTGILGNFYTLQQLMYTLIRKYIAPKKISGIDGNSLRRNIIVYMMLISIPIPFLGRSVIGWIVDINTIGASIAYLYTSYATFKNAKEHNRTIYKLTGLAGVLCSIFFFLYFLVPSFSAISTLSTESYLILVIWSILGFLVFRYIFQKDSEWRIGNSTVVWVVLLFIITFTTLLWTRQSLDQTMKSVMNNLHEYNHNVYEENGVILEEEKRVETDEYLDSQVAIVNKQLITNSMIQMFLAILVLATLFNLFTAIIKRQKDASDDLIRAKNDFLANMSHEIRTPINTILGMDEMILRETKDTEIHQYATNIKNAGIMLMSLISDVLDFSKIESGKEKLVKDEYDLEVLISDAVANVTPRALDKDLYLDTNVNPEMPHILFGDNLRLRQILLNLLTNAVKYTESGGICVDFDFEKTGDDLIDMTISVRDTGIGIKEEDIKRIFDAFERLDEKRNRTIEGTGLGMNIVRHLLELMNSSLNMQSVYGEGSTFSFTVQQEVLDWDPIGEFTPRTNSGPKDDYVYVPSFCAPAARILMVDDTDMNLLVIKGLLRDTGIQIDTACDGLDGLEKTQNTEYDLLLIDHRMPVMDGMEMLHKLRSMQDNPNHSKPCISLTANAGIGAREEYLSAGFDDYIIKPVDSNRLEQALIKYLPDDKLEDPEDSAEESTEQVSSENETPNEETENTDVISKLEVMGVDINEGIEYAGSKDLYLMVFQMFSNTVEVKRKEICDYYESGDWENYITKVHALKSSAKVIGAMELSEHARLLEMAGKHEDFDYIHSNHESVMNEFDQYNGIA